MKVAGRPAAEAMNVAMRVKNRLTLGPSDRGGQPMRPARTSRP